MQSDSPSHLMRTPKTRGEDPSPLVVGRTNSTSSLAFPIIPIPRPHYCGGGVSEFHGPMTPCTEVSNRQRMREKYSYLGMVMLAKLTRSRQEGTAKLVRNRPPSQFMRLVAVWQLVFIKVKLHLYCSGISTIIGMPCNSFFGGGVHPPRARKSRHRTTSYIPHTGLLNWSGHH